MTRLGMLSAAVLFLQTMNCLALSTGDLYVTTWIPEKACNGTTLFADGHSATNPRIVEVDMQGNIVWEWYLTNGIKQFTNPGFDAELLTNNNVLITLPGKGILEIDRNGVEKWRHEDSRISHDSDRLSDGSTLYTYGDDDTPFDAVVKKVGTNGIVQDLWFGTNAFMVSPYWPTNNVTREGWIHCNGATMMTNGSILVSLRNFNQTIMVGTNGAISWTMNYTNLYGGAYSPPSALGYDPHDPELSVDETRMLVCLQRDAPYQVVELDVNAKTTTWTYAREGLRTCRDANRLTNGNILIVGVLTNGAIDESVMFEVTQAGEIVWELRFWELDASSKPGYFFKGQRLAVWPDTDYDGIVDQTDTDDDNDGLTDTDEAVAGTSPTNALDVFEITSISNRSTTQSVIFWDTHTGRTYKVYTSTDLVTSSWSTDAVYQVGGSGSSASYTNSSSVNKQFYRLGVSPQ